VAASETSVRGAGPLARVPSAALVLGAITSVQFGAALAVTLFDTVGPAGTVLLRLGFAALALAAVARPRLRGHSARELRLVAIFGLVLGGMNLCFYESVQRLPLGIAVAVEFVGPLGVAVAGSRRALDLLWVAMAAVGIVALTHDGGHPVSALGVGFALAAGALWAAYILLNARLGRAFSDGSGLTLAMCVGFVALLPFGVAEGGGNLLSAESLALGAAVGVLSSALPYSFEMEALRRIAPPVFGVLMSLEPAVAAAAGAIVLGQSLSARVVLGIALVVIASVAASRRASRQAIAV
jgi:inner membrane transporter RhtA